MTSLSSELKVGVVPVRRHDVGGDDLDRVGRSMVRAAVSQSKVELG